jgi:hypothetical protein
MKMKSRTRNAIRVATSVCARDSRGGSLAESAMAFPRDRWSESWKRMRYKRPRLISAPNARASDSGKSLLEYSAECCKAGYKLSLSYRTEIGFVSLRFSKGSGRHHVHQKLGALRSPRGQVVNELPSMQMNRRTYVDTDTGEQG